MGRGEEVTRKALEADEPRTVLFDNLIDRTVKRGEILKALGIKSPARFEHAPIQCSECGSHHITGLEILGAYQGTLLWECDYCSKLYLRFGRCKTEDMLEVLRGTWINPNDWSRSSNNEAN